MSDEPSLLEHYNYATLRMYHRIIDYRSKYPVSYDDDGNEKAASDRGHGNDTRRAAVDLRSSPSDDAAAAPRQLHHGGVYDDDCDAIFDMDL